uniref:GUN4-like domain-containing protein n=1 Tax=Chlamydomonas leiostraca TaxID=1034604 RepID=A0A7S0RYY0_9CHLO|mmetsp:Transcript_34582/g.87468  ORF Transcript_34582/g.87468 Transcript_34582/m.87468 type:complete len:258 (+) Transcript_34582:126-899(+)|eukprot:CAMPEP_0202864904 /NCGR_PEP_ID=MMETSP1391-20130828/4949_1 /ASSEMBLY_ACC=CAM_ASM_000867 /TAXON_ID=1034604 /ORGANISM="Chlamydomonas leiostraca, Strain SAG 11-49" /LENGTH=257 /DNA_ID=CAMNT_0049544681 /DNA_START=137 /DNA_END=910 /DNA_ORIENTATION=+
MQALQSSQAAAHGARVARGSVPRPVPFCPSRGNLHSVPSAPSCSPRVIATRASKLGDVNLFGGDTASLLGGPTVEEKSAKPKLDDIPLQSEVGMDYSLLRDALKEGDFRKADDETRALLIRLAGEGAIKRGWVYFTEVRSISVTDFQTMDTLWKTASNGKFGYSVQKEIFTQNQKRWGKFFKQIDWTTGENNNYRKWPMEFIYSMDAPRGHLPLTNALRGTQLFTEVLNHPAWDKTGAAKMSIDEKAKAAGTNTLKW